MDASKLTQMRMQAANTYKSNWQGRDASEVTMRNHQMAQKNNSSVHQGPAAACCTGGAPNTAIVPPGNGFNTSYQEQVILTNKKAGCANCNDPVWGTAGGVDLQNCSTIATILAVPPNPVKGSSCYCADPGVPFHATVDCTKVAPAYSGWRNQVPVSDTGTKRIQYPPYPSG